MSFILSGFALQPLLLLLLLLQLLSPPSQPGLEALAIVDHHPDDEYLLEHEVPYERALAEARGLKLYPGESSTHSPAFPSPLSNPRPTSRNPLHHYGHWLPAPTSRPDLSPRPLAPTNRVHWTFQEPCQDASPAAGTR
jgi:hypothetical protein